MREIKFRAWDKRFNELLGWERIKKWEMCILNDGVQTARVFMQYTDLKDKNGKEIYEGDIIKSEASYPLEVFWMGLAWGTRWKDNGNEETDIICDDGGDMGMDKKGLKYMEIIGNIYENPELLK